MNRHVMFMVSASLVALTTASGTAFAQSQSDTPLGSVRLAERSAQMKMSLAEAIDLAEKHTKGVVIGIRLSSDRNIFHTEANGLVETRDGTWEERGSGGKRDDRDRIDEPAVERKDAQPGVERKGAQPGVERGGDPASVRQSMEPQGSSEPLVAIVTCVIDLARVRDVVIDMKDGRVLGMQSVYAGRHGGARGEYSRDMDGDQSRFLLVRASDLMNATARDGEGQRIGDIDELVLNPDSDRILYGVLRRGGFLGFNESRYAVSTSELSVPKDGSIVLNLSNSDFQGHSGFDSEKWPTQADPEWSTGWNSDDERAPLATRILKASDLIGTDVGCGEGQKVGEISDLIVEPRSGRVVYAIVKSERGEIVVPISVLHAEGEGRVMRMTHAEVLALPTLDGERDPDWSDARWNRRMHDAYNARMNLTAAPTERSRR